MRINGYRTLWNSLAAAFALLFLIQSSLLAHHHHWRHGTKRAHVALHRKHHFASKKHIPTTSEQQSTTFGHVKHGRVSLKSDGKIVGSLTPSDRFTILARDGERFRICLANGRTGAVPVALVNMEETRKPLPVSDSWSVKGDVVRMAYACRGSRYRAGGVSRGGFDCSGFVKYLYSHEGVSLPHSSSAQYGYGKPVSRAKLQPGNMVFFKGTYRRGISHVGVYVGDGKFIHASTYRTGVKEDSLDAPYYSAHYVGARRP